MREDSVTLNALAPTESFDAIIVGAGPAGCVLASRLSEVPNKRILLIEAGPDATAPGREHPDLLDSFCLVASGNPAFRWPNLKADISNLDSARRERPYIQGFGVGGASNINGMGADRGQPGDYDHWRTLGAVGWSWNDVLPYFIKIERDLDLTGPMHGDSGPMPVRRQHRSQWAPFAAAVGDALVRRGFPLIDDYMTNFADGLSAVPTNCLNQRVSAAIAYLSSSVRRRNSLWILTGATADRLSFDGLRANGVFVRAQNRVTFIPGRHLIVSCGAIHTPTLLMRSGIGPRGELADLGITCIRDLLGVGSNLQNHPHVTIPTYLRQDAVQPHDNPCLLQNWLRFSSGYPACPPGDMHLMIFNKCAWHRLGTRVGAIVVSVLKSFATGKVELTNTDPTVPPRVQFNLFPDSRDDERLVAGVRLALQLLVDHQVASHRHEAFIPNAQLTSSLSERRYWNGVKASLIATILDHKTLRRSLLSSSTLDLDKLLHDDNQLRQFVRDHTGIQYHVCGTCRMGDSKDSHSVVDGSGRVHGLAGLRIVDASIFPTIPRGYIHFIVLMAAEKLADDIKVEWDASTGHTEQRLSRHE